MWETQRVPCAQRGVCRTPHTSCAVCHSKYALEKTQEVCGAPQVYVELCDNVELPLEIKSFVNSLSHFINL